jgi:hypothetical protein
VTEPLLVNGPASLEALFKTRFTGDPESAVTPVSRSPVYKPPRKVTETALTVAENGEVVPVIWSLHGLEGVAFTVVGYLHPLKNPPVMFTPTVPPFVVVDKFSDELEHEFTVIVPEVRATFAAVPTAVVPFATTAVWLLVV